MCNKAAGLGRCFRYGNQMVENGPENPNREQETDRGNDSSQPQTGGGWVTPPPAEWGWGEKKTAGGQQGAASGDGSAAENRPVIDPRPAGNNQPHTHQHPFMDHRPVSGHPFEYQALPAAGTAGTGEQALPRKRSLVRRLVRDVFIPLTMAVLLALIFQATVAKPYQIPSGSMLPTIQISDRILADRLVYHFRSIQRGDVIVFNPPAGVESDTPFVKRVIGLPGDTVEVRGGKVLVNGQEFDVAGATTPTYVMPAEKVPDKQLFVLGDNRNESYDSHRWGFVPKDNVIGRADLIYWPPDHIGAF